MGRRQMREHARVSDSPQHPVALVPSPPERQRLGVVKELAQVGGRRLVRGAEVEAAVPRVALCSPRRTDGADMDDGSGTAGVGQT